MTQPELAVGRVEWSARLHITYVEAARFVTLCGRWSRWREVPPARARPSCPKCERELGYRKWRL